MGPQGGFGNGGPGDGPPMEVIIGILVCAGVFLIAFLIVYIFYLLTLSRCFGLISARNRQMEPGQVWLNLIPLFNIVWIFITVIRLSDSLRDEFEDRRLPDDGDFGKQLGIIYNVLNLIGGIPYIGILFGLGAFVCWIIYWVKIAGYNKQMREDDAEGGRPRRRRQDDRDDDDADADRYDDEGRRYYR